MAENGPQRSHEQITKAPRHADGNNSDALAACANLTGSDGRPQTQSSATKPVCNLPALSLEAERPGVETVAKQLRNTTMLGLKSWVYPEAVVDALRTVHPTNAYRFETAFTKFKGGDLRTELKDKLDPDQFRTAIALLENRQDEKRTADSLTAALHKTSYWGLKSNPDLMTVTTSLASMDRKQLAQFEANFPRNVGDDVTLKGELRKYLGDGPEYKEIVAMLPDVTAPATAQAEVQPETAAPAAPEPRKGQASLKEWLESFSKLNKAMAIRGIDDIDPRSIDEKQFKLDYAREAVRVGKEYGFTPAQVKEIASGMYAVELGGWGTSYTTANMPMSLLHPVKEDERFNFRPSTSAVGYNQLLKSTTMDIVKNYGTEISDRLKELGSALPPGDPHAKQLVAKAQMVQVLSNLISKEAKPPGGLTKKEFSEAVQALNMDKDIGPVIQGQQLGSLFDWYTTKKLQHGNQDVKQVLQPVAARLNAKATSFDHLPAQQRAAAIGTILSLTKPSEKELPHQARLATKLRSLRPGLDSKLDLSPPEQRLLTQATQRAETTTADGAARALLHKLAALPIGKLTVEKLTPAAIELANLAGLGGANGILKNPHHSTSKYFSGDGLAGNGIVQNKDGEKLLVDIYATMQAKKKHQYQGNAEFRDAFEQQVRRKTR